jgi:hypothetical protein
MPDTFDSENPFRPPQPAPEAEAAAPRAGRPLEWSPFDAFSFAWRALIAQPTVVVAFLVAILVQAPIPLLTFVVQMALGVTGDEQNEVLGIALNLAGSLLNIPLTAWMMLGQTRIALDLCRGKRPPIGRLFETSRFVPALLAQLVAQFGGMLIAGVALVVLVGPGAAVLAMTDGGAVGFLVLIPGLLIFTVLCIYFAVRVAWWFQALVYAETGPVDCFVLAFKRSSGQFGWLFLTFLIGVATLIAAFFLGCCPGLFVGLLFTVPFARALWMVALMYGFMFRSGETPRLSTPE